MRFALPHFCRAAVVAAGLACAPFAADAASFLFDATKAEMAGNADWVIDADVHNIKISAVSDGSGTPGSGNESNPQRFPTPDQTNVVAGTAENYWQGALSAWAIDIVKNGHHVETLPYNGRITYKDSSNAQDLTNYNVFVLVEPNILFTATEKAAIISFVTNGGGLFIVSDHGSSDRNADGADSVQVLNDLMTNSILNNPFGLRFNGDNFSGSMPYPDTSTNDPVTHGAAGTVADFYYNNGSSITISTNQNASVKTALWRTSTHATNNAIAVYATCGNGKVVATGDSSPFDDGTGDTGDSLFFSQGYADPSTSNGKLILNASLWLALAPAPPPVLQILSLANSVQLSWPTSAVNFTLQATTNLFLTNSWSAVTNAPQTVATNYVVTNIVSTSVNFHRLIRTP
jgi:hypothetical protein